MTSHKCNLLRTPKCPYTYTSSNAATVPTFMSLPEIDLYF